MNKQIKQKFDTELRDEYNEMTSNLSDMLERIKLYNFTSFDEYKQKIIEMLEEERVKENEVGRTERSSVDMIGHIIKKIKEL